MKDRRIRQYDEAEKALPDNVESDRRQIRYQYDKPKTNGVSLIATKCRRTTQIIH